MKLTANQAQLLLNKYKADFETANDSAQRAKGLLALMPNHTSDTSATLRMQIIPLVISALEAVANDDASLFAPELPQKADLTTEDKDKLAFHAESFGTPPDARACLKLIFITKAAIPAEDYGKFILNIAYNYCTSGTVYASLKSLSQSVINAEQASSVEIAEAEITKDVITSVLDDIVEEAIKTADKPAPQKTNSEPTFNNATFALNCLSGLAMLAGGILVVAAMIALKPLLVIGGLALAAIGAMSLVKTSEHGLFSQTAKTDDSTANTSTASNTAAL